MGTRGSGVRKSPWYFCDPPDMESGWVSFRGRVSTELPEHGLVNLFTVLWG